MLRQPWSIAAAVLLCLLVLLVQAQEHKIVVGPRNVELADGADALLAGDAEEGIRLTMAGLQHAAGRRERLIGTSNLCAGYILQQRYAEALRQCERALAEDENYWRARTNRALIYVLEGRYEEADRDLDLVEEVAPHAFTVKAVRALLQERLNPVEPIITIDDRRNPGEDDNGD